MLSSIVLASILIGAVGSSSDVSIDPSAIRGQRWEGTGVSLAWWANVFGDQDILADMFFSMKTTTYNGVEMPGLGMNIARYNAGASSTHVINGETMVVSPHMQKFKQLDSFWLDWFSEDPSSSSWNWNVDVKQRAMLQKAQARGVNHIELFSNSPVWWMLNNHNPSGGKLGMENLQTWNYVKHGTYLATIAAYAVEHWGITFTSVEPMNEASADWWKDSGTQEGCHMGSSTQSKVILALREELDKRGLANTPIAASDESLYDQAVSVWNSFDKATKSAIGPRVNVHGYQYEGGRRDTLFDIVSKDGKKLWQSEFGDGDASGMRMAVNFMLDVKWLHPVAWIYWQAIDEAGGWGFLRGDMDKGVLYEASTKYYVFAQISRHVREGMLLLDVADSNVACFFDDKKHKLVLIAVNSLAVDHTVTVDLKEFNGFSGLSVGSGSSVQRWNTATAGTDRYAFHSDTVVGKDLTFSIIMAGNSVQTVEVQLVAAAAEGLGLRGVAMM